MWNTTWQHTPILLREINDIFNTIDAPNLVVDATAWLGWHSEMLLKNMSLNSIWVGIDRDKENIECTKKRLIHCSPDITKHYIHWNFWDIDTILNPITGNNIDFALYDLGVSSAHYDDGKRGFSIRSDAPLDMRFDRSDGKTAHDIVMNASEYELRSIMTRYADEKKAVFIARAIVESRKTNNIQTTFDLLRIIQWASYDRHSPKRVFQALRIATNDEFLHIEISLKKTIDRLAIGGILVVITFHSIEDRMVKNVFAPYLKKTIDVMTGKELQPPTLKKYTKKPIIPSSQEVQSNPRSRSAKMRVIQKIN